MFLKSRSIFLFVLALSISFFTLGFIGINTSANAQDTNLPQTSEATKPQSNECPLKKGGNPSGIASAECASQSGCKQDKSWHRNVCCAVAQGCDTPCNKEDGYGGGHSAADMIGLVHCAKKELLKEKIKAKLETKMGSKLDKVADLLVEAVFEEYKAGREDKERRSELEKKLIEIFSGNENK